MNKFLCTNLSWLFPHVTILSWEELVVIGGYPKKYQFDIASNDYYPNYIQTYIERDVSQIINVMDLGNFQKFLKLLAGRVGPLSTP